MEKAISQPDLTDLAVLKSVRYDEIDAKTGLLISQGFTHNGVVFSLSANAQANLLGVYSARELLTYPFQWNAIDDSSTYEIADAVEMATFFMTALATKKARQDSGTALKIQIRDAVSIEAVNLIVDNR